VAILEVAPVNELKRSLPDVLPLRLRQARLSREIKGRF
jgi:hypothetical protein